MKKDKLNQINELKTPKNGCFFAILILLGITFFIFYK